MELANAIEKQTQGAEFVRADLHIHSFGTGTDAEMADFLEVGYDDLEPVEDRAQGAGGRGPMNEKGRGTAKAILIVRQLLGPDEQPRTAADVTDQYTRMCLSLARSRCN